VRKRGENRHEEENTSNFYWGVATVVAWSCGWEEPSAVGSMLG